MSPSYRHHCCQNCHCHCHCNHNQNDHPNPCHDSHFNLCPARSLSFLWCFRPAQSILVFISTAKRCSQNHCLQRFPIQSQSQSNPLIAFEHLSLSIVDRNIARRPRQINVDQDRPKQVTILRNFPKFPKFSKISKIFQIFQIFPKCPKFSKFFKFFQIFPQFPKISKFSKNFQIFQIFQNFPNVPKFSKCSEILQIF